MSPATRYRRVRQRLWTEPSFKKLNEREKLLALYLLSGPQTNSVGLFQFSPARAAEDLRTSDTSVRRSVDTVLRSFGWIHESDTDLLWLTQWIEENAPQNPNMVRAWRSAFD